MKPRNFISIGIMILLLGNIIPAGGVANLKAGGNFKIGDSVPDSLEKKLLLSDLTGNREWQIGLILFTRSGQRFSVKLVEELEGLLVENSAAALQVQEIITINPSDSSEIAVDLKNRLWPVHVDRSHNLYDAFGLKLLPTIFVVTDTFEIIGYFPGRSPQTIINLKKNINSYRPELFPLTDTVLYKPEKKRLNRREKLARKLYQKEQYLLALSQISGLDSLSMEGQILKAYTYIQLKEYEKAEQLLTGLIYQEKIENYVHYGLGVIALQTDQIALALDHLLEVRTIPDMYRVHYRLGQTYEKLGQTDQALIEYQKSLTQVFRKLSAPYLP